MLLEVPAEYLCSLIGSLNKCCPKCSRHVENVLFLSEHLNLEDVEDSNGAASWELETQEVHPVLSGPTLMTKDDNKASQRVPGWWCLHK